MDHSENNGQQPPPDANAANLGNQTPAPLAPWSEPKLAFVDPVLRNEGDLTEVTGQGFFGTFIPER